MHVCMYVCACKQTGRQIDRHVGRGGVSGRRASQRSELLTLRSVGPNPSSVPRGLTLEWRGEREPGGSMPLTTSTIETLQEDWEVVDGTASKSFNWNPSSPDSPHAGDFTWGANDEA